jgi:hypothetical protein
LHTQSLSFLFIDVTTALAAASATAAAAAPQPPPLSKIWGGVGCENNQPKQIMPALSE